MLLLVLILVLVAFALLVVALLSGSVLSAWLSVAVSVAAAVVLVVDWLQRRSAVKAGSGAVSGSSRALTDADPVTEVLPVVPVGVSGSRFDESDDSQRTVVMKAVKPAAEADDQPSGSAPGPSGAEDDITSSSGSSSPSVTKEPIDHPVESASSGADPSVSAVEQTVVVDVSKRKTTAATDVAKAGTGDTGTADGAAPARNADRPSTAAGAGAAAAGAAAAGAAVAAAADRTPPDRTGDGGGPLATAGSPASASPASEPASRSAPASSDAVVPSGAPGASTPASAAPERAEPGAAAFGSTSSTAALPPVVRNGATSGPGRSDAAPSGDTTAREAAPQAAEPPASTAALSGSGPSGSGTRGSGTPGSGAADAPRSDAPDLPDSTAGPVGGDTVATRIPAERNGRSADGSPTGGAEEPSGARVEPAYAGGLFEPVTAGSPPADEPVPPPVDDEPSEEQHDAAAARIVTGLTDEVLVIDEQPRYHVDRCRALTGRPVIPLPAREAVELGFTPCGWCTPDATLAARHSADSRP